MPEEAITALTEATDIRENDYFIIARAGGLSRKISGFTVRGGVFNILDYGAVGDGTTGNAAAVQAAIDAAAVDGGKVLVPKVSNGYRLESTVNLYSNVEIIGEEAAADAASLFIWNPGAVADPMWTHDSASVLSGFRMENIACKRTSGTGPCFKLYCPTNNTLFRRIAIEAFNGANGHAFYLAKASAGDTVHSAYNATFENIFSINNGGYSFYSDGDCTAVFANCDINKPGLGGFYFANGVTANQNSILIIQPMFEMSGGAAGLHAITLDSMTSYLVNIISPQFFGAGGGADFVHVSGQTAYVNIIGGSGAATGFTNWFNDTVNSYTIAASNRTNYYGIVTAMQALIAQGKGAVIDLYDLAGTTNHRYYRQRATAGLWIFDARNDAAGSAAEVIRVDHATALTMFKNGAILGDTATTAARDLQGTGDPEGSVTAPVGSTYRRKDGGVGTSFYVKETGTGNTGWAAK